ncbi:AAA family ATPase [Kinneretia aquatilis]|uniref:AAA family ATPase n=1 Tax=Kinneretia aquatilis TaxID=2070761 RepID=UPI0014953337|nr:ATP-binding protein [Paucibacter aquatile]WIV99680.1 ATP-binding protein [Paucibacter aquatile]
MTAQVSDVLCIEGHRRPLICEPLLGWLLRKKNRPLRLKRRTTACSRGYVAEWAIFNGRLFLTHVHGQWRDGSVVVANELFIHYSSQYFESVGARSPDNAELSSNLERLGQSLVLDELEQRLLGFAILLHVEPMLADVADVLGLLSEARAHRVLADILDLTHTAVSAALHPRARLTLTCLLTPRQRGTTRLRERFQLWSDSFANQMLLAEGEPMSFLRESFSPSSPAELTLRDFEHLRGVLSLLLPYLRNSLAQARPSVNVLIHGAPGTGKTQLAKVLAVELGAELFEVSCEDEDGDPVTGGRRLIAYRVAQQALARRRSLLLFDEFEDVLGGGGFPLTGSPGGSRKAWAHKVLESNPVPTLWLGNDIASIDAAVLRRFDLVIEMPMSPRHLRTGLLESAVGGVLPRSLLDRMAACDHLAPATLTRATSVLAVIGDDLAPEQRATAVSRLVDQALAAQRLPALIPSAHACGEVYSPEFSNADADLTAVAEGVASGGMGARLCLHGPPGTGKTAWAHWLARRLERPLLVKRASDLLDAYVGQSEKNLCKAFVEARQRGAVLLIDEVDSFVQRRAGADSQWRVQLVNEMLTQMEAFDGLFVATTNELDALDLAALRRFDLKIGFDALNGAQTAALLVRYAARLELPPADDALLERAQRVRGATPGDFAAAARRHRFCRLGSARGLLEAVQGEVALRDRRGSRPIGFVAVA